MKLILDLFTEQVKARPQKVAVNDAANGIFYTYAELDTLSRRIAAKLRNDGVRRGDKVILTPARSAGYIAAIVGVMMAGGVYVPLSQNYPAERIEYIRSDCGAKVRLDDAYLAAAMDCEPLAQSVQIQPEDAALVCYTSGSTGNPKGILHDQRSLAEITNRFLKMSELDARDVYANNVPPYFIVHVMDIFCPLTAGMTVQLVPEALRGDPEGLADFISEHGVTAIFISPKVLRYFKNRSDTLRFVSTGSERVSRLVPDGYRLLNAYGMTETTGVALGFTIDKAYDNTPIGAPCQGVAVYLLDEAGNPCDEGEICVAGHMGQGYLNLPEQSAQTFTPNPFREKDGLETLIHTGDLGRRLADGNILYLNRKDWMIKINGQRVEPGEIEAAIRRLAGVSEAAVKDFTDEAGKTTICAYYVSEQPLDEDELHTQLAQTLPEYMLPSFFVHLDALPVNANGKLDRTALEQPNLSTHKAAYVPPENETQERIVAAFEETLGVSGIGIQDDFFSLGGDSIRVLALQRVLSDFGFSSSDIFSARTPEALSDIASDRRGALSVAEFCAAESESYPLTESQLAVYLDSSDPNRQTVYNITFGLFLPLDMGLDAQRVALAASEVLNRYEILKAHVAVVDGVPSFVPDKSYVYQVPVQTVEETDREKLARDFIRPFDLEKGILLRSAVFEMPDGLFLLFDVHHVLCDGTSVSILIDNVARSLRGEVLRQETVSNLTLSQYEAAVERTEREADAAFYQQMLNQMDGDMELFADDDPALAPYSGKLGLYRTDCFTDWDETRAALQRILPQMGVTESTVFMGAYAYLLRLLSGQKDVLFFVGENGRHDPALSDTFGMMVHNLPLFTPIDESDSAQAFLVGLQKRFYGCVEHDGAPVSELLGEYHIRPSYSFVYQGNMLTGVTVAGRNIPLEIYKAEDAMGYLTLHVMKQRGGNYLLHFEYDAGIFTAETVERMAALYKRIVAGLVTGGALKEIPLCGDAERAEMDAFNATEQDYEVADIVTLFRRQVQTHPDRNAVFYKDTVLSYREVDEISDRIAGYLRRLGVGKGSVVSILIPRSTYMVTASLGVLKTGAAYQPLDPTYPPERLDFMMQDAQAACLIADAELLSRVPEYRGEVLLLKDIPSLPPCEPLKERPSPEDLFILLYTSGSTGTPKGVQLVHKNLANFCSWYRAFYDLDETSRVAAYASYGFDAHMMDLYPALTTGACVYIIEEEIRLDLLELESYFNRNAITHAFMTTQVARQFYTMTDVKPLRFLSTGGEKLVPLPPVEGAAPLYNCYGPTECTICTTTKRVDRLYQRVPIGKPLDNYKVYVMDEYGRRLPPLVPGELLISGAGVAKGYLNRSDLTEKAFIPNPFTNQEGYTRAYRSGDVVRLLPSGEVDFIGRNDGQVKVRGFRIELTEVERIIREFPGIQDATVQVFEDAGTGEKYLAAYVVSDDIVDIDALHAFIRSEKPPYMVPSVTMQLDAIPLNQNQKVDKKSLPRPVRRKAETVPPQNQTQQIIFECVSEVVGHKDFDVTTDIFEAGLSSIGSIRLNVLLSKAFDIPVSTRDLKECCTVQKLEAFVNTKKAKSVKSTFPVQPDYPLSKTQEGIYVECIAKPGTTSYNIPILLRLDSSIEEQRLKEAVAAAVNAHPFLKTRLFLNEDGEARMRRMDADMSFDAAGVEVIEAESIDELKDGGLVKPFKLIGGRLFRIALIHAHGLYLFIEMHHLVSDGTSMQVFLQDISDAYAGNEVQTETFTGYEAVLNEIHIRTAEKLEEAKQYYGMLLSDAETSSLPAGDLKERNEGVSGLYEADGVYATADAVRSFCKENGLSMNAFFSAAFGVMLNGCLGTESAVFAGIYNGRSDSRFTNMVAMLVKTIPIVSAPKAAESVVEHVRAMGCQLNDTMARDLYSFAEISRKFHVNADVMFAYQGDEFHFDSLCGAPAEMVSLDLGEVKAPLNVNLYLLGNAIRYSFEYRADRYSEGRIHDMVDALDKAVQEMLTRERMSEISFVTEQAAAQLRQFNDTDVEIHAEFAPQRMERAAKEYGDRTAVIARSGTVSLTFTELNERANKIAHALANKGLGRGRRVGLYMERTEDVYPVRQGILKSGAAFVSLEPDYPDERIEFILRDAGIDTLLTTEELFRERQRLFHREGLNVMFVAGIYASDLSVDNPDLSALQEDDPAYCIYTSGSTGNPKGVEITHGNLRNLLDYNEKNTLAHAYVDHSTVWLALAAITFDVSVIEEMMPLYHGKTVTIATGDEIHNPMLLLRTLKKTGVDMMKCTPSYMLSILEVPDSDDVFRQLKAVILGAEPFPVQLYQKMRDAGFTGIIFNSYGPTETCVSVSIGTLDGEHVTIGGPTANTRFFIRDRFGNVLPKWMRGELVIAGEQVGNGYIGLPEKTKEVYIHVNPDGKTTPDGTLPAYRSGDVAYWNERGEIVHCGRNDNQVKLRGLRIELDGIENVMNSFPTIERSVVRVLGEGDGKYLCGYYVAPHPVDEEALSAHLRKTLTAYMVPGVYVHLEKLPLTVNGKVNKRALPMPAAPEKRGTVKEATTQLQKTIAGMFERALGVEHVGVDEDFFEIGGTSMLASKVAMSAMVQELPIAYQDIFANPTVEQLEAHVLKMQGASEEKAEPSAEASEDASKDGIKAALAKNTMAYIDGIAPGKLGNVLLTGATGFLGIHMLRHLLEHETGNILCLIRKGKSSSVEKRLKTMLVYYFDQSYDEAFESGRLTVVNGDITDRDTVLALRDVQMDMVINCAACVKHFAADDILERVNVTGVKNLIELCENTQTRLIQISTVSVAGEDVNYALPAHTVMYENMLYFGQDLSNQYVHSKFAAEQAVLNEVAAGKLDAKIIRVGNLMSRNSDGEFQANAVTSGFMRNLRGYATIGAYPVDEMARPVEFSPIDTVAEAVCLLAGTPKQYTVFHAVNGHWIEMGDLIAAMNAEGLAVEITDRKAFERRLREEMADEKQNMLVSGLISYLSSDSGSVRRYVPENHTFTKNALYRLGFRWPLTDENYLRNVIRALVTFGFFDADNA